MTTSTKVISPLRQRMIDDMRMRRLAPKTQEGYLRVVRQFTVFLGRSPDTATVEAGSETPDTPFIDAVTTAARKSGLAFEKAISCGEISAEDLFDHAYRSVAGTNPEQFTTRYNNLTDRLLPELQEPLLTLNERVVFCAAVDTEGYLLTHNKKSSQPQGSDPIWNAANSRNRRVFNDRTGLTSGSHTRPFLLQTYRRDMGAGQYALMKDVSAPSWSRGATGAGCALHTVLNVTEDRNY